MKKILALTFLVLLQGCASRIDFTSTQNNLMKSMTDAKANLIINKSFANNKKQSGLFSSNGSPLLSNPKVLQVKDGVVVYTDYEGTLTNVRKKALLDLKWVHTTKNYRFDFRKVNVIRIVNKSVFREDIIKSINGVQFLVSNKNGNFINLDVKKELADNIIAVTKFYSPNVLLMK